MSLFMKQSLLENLQKLYDNKKYQEIVDTLLEIEPEQWGYDLTCIFARMNWENMTTLWDIF